MNQKKQPSKCRWAFWVYLLVAIILTYPIWRHTGNPLRYDWTWPIFDMRELWQGLFAADTPQSVLSIFSTNASFLLGIPGIFHVPPGWCLKFFMATIHTLAGYGFFRLALARVKKPWLAFLGGLIYAFAPYIFIRTIVGFIFSLVAYATLPFFFVTFCDDQKKHLKSYLWLGFLLTLIFAQVQAGLLTVLFIVIYVAVSRKDWRRNSTTLGGIILGFVVFNAPWIVMVLLRDGSTATPSGSEATTLSFIASLPHSLKMMLMTTDHHITQNYFISLSGRRWVEFGYGLFYLVGLASIFSAKHRRLAATALISLLLVIPFATGPSGRFGAVFTWVYNHCSYLAVFRETYHFQFLIAFAGIVLFILGVDTLLSALRAKAARIVFGVVTIAISIPIIYPYFSFDYAGYLSLQTIPDPYKELKQYFGDNPTTCTNIFYPPGLGFVAFKDDPLKNIGATNADSVAQALGIGYLDEGSSALSLPNQDTYYRNELVSQFYEKGDNDEFAALIAEGKIDCVVIRTDIVTMYANATNLNRETDLAIRNKWLNEDYLGLMRNKKGFIETANFGSTIYIFKPNGINLLSTDTEDGTGQAPISDPDLPATRLPLSDWANDSSYFRNGWTRGRYDFWYKHLFTKLRQDFVITDKVGAVLSGRTNERGTYEVWIRRLDGGLPGQIDIDIGGTTLTATKESGNERFVWQDLGSTNIMDGSITITNIAGENAIADLLLIKS